MASQDEFRFFDLPGELRSDIFKYLVLVPTSIPCHCLSRSGTANSSPVEIIYLFLVCSQMYQEASGLFYTQNRFWIDLGARRLYHQITEEGQLFSSEMLNTRHRIRDLTVCMKRIGGDFERVVEPVLSDMVLCGALRNLQFRFMPQDPGNKKPHSSDAGDLVITSPFQALLRLLTDPDLERVELWVSPIHLTVWCPFHEPTARHGTRRQGLKQHEVEWIKVDWRRVVEAWRDGNQIIKVRSGR
ncbi:hypothetical protein BX600DRAFT_45073 [Xylariales sp. PMI_506]|nr:hypothetical protein BX600DRAFT_45073 [Xylariales sp. PMI_506]